jgi:hypothetical protein
MRRLEWTEIPTYVLDSKEYNARRVAGALIAYEAKHDRPPTFREMAMGTRLSLNGYLSECLDLAVELGLLECTPVVPRRRQAARAYHAPRAA